MEELRNLIRKITGMGEREENETDEGISRREFGKLLGLGSAAGAGALMFSDAARAATTVDPDFLSLDDGGDLRFGNDNDFELRYNSSTGQLELVGNSNVWNVSSSGNFNLENRDLDMGTGAITNVGNVDGVDVSSHAGNSSAHHSKTTSLTELNDVTGIDAFEEGTSGDRPSAGTEGRIFFETDNQRVLYDNGTSWIEVGVTTHSQLDVIGTEDHHSPGDHLQNNSGTFDVTPSTIEADNLSGSNGSSGQVLKTDGTNASWGSTSSVSVPVGGIIAWDKSRTNTPSLPVNYAECNGQTVSDADSPYDGQTLPDLNGNNRFLRGNSSSGATGGADTVTLSVSEIPSHNHGIPVEQTEYDNDNMPKGTPETSNRAGTWNSDSTGGDSAHENKPPYYDVVYVMRIK